MLIIMSLELYIHIFAFSLAAPFSLKPTYLCFALKAPTDPRAFLRFSPLITLVKMDQLVNLEVQTAECILLCVLFPPSDQSISKAYNAY